MVSDDLLLEVATTLVERGTVLFLTPTMEEADRFAAHFRTIFVKSAAKALEKTEQEVLKKLLKPVGLNPSFVALANGGWVLFYQADDVSADEPIGDPKVVYWPTNAGEYATVTYREWQKARRKNVVWRPLPPAPRQPKTGTIWDRVLDADDDDEVL